MIVAVTNSIRIRHEGDYGCDDIHVEYLLNDEWVKYRSFNSLSDNYAHTGAKKAAFNLQRERNKLVATHI